MKVATTRHSPAYSRATGQQGVWMRLLIVGSLSLLATVPVAGLVGLLSGGMPAASSAALGAVLVGVFLLCGFVGLSVVLKASPLLHMPGALSIYGFQILVVVSVWLEVKRGGLSLPSIDPLMFGMGALTAALVWQVALTWVLLHTRQTLIIGADGDDGGAAS